MIEKFAKLLVVGLVSLLSFSAMAQETPNAGADIAKVLSVRVTSTPVRARLIVDLSASTQFSFVSLNDPKRIAVDVLAKDYTGPNAGNAAGTGLIGAFEISQLDGQRLRTMLTLNGSAQVQQAYILDAFEGQPTRLVVDIIGAEDGVFALRAEADRLAFIRTAQSNQIVSREPDVPGGSQIQASSRPLILIDPGHGGVDGGATTAQGTREKEITLLFAQQLQDVLIASDRFDVALTRDDDSFFRLEQRVQLARDNQADLLISIHADSFEDSAIRGASVYIRDEEATDILDKVLAENENKVDLLAGVLPDADEPVVVDILVDLMRREMRRQSFIAANAIVEQLKPSIRVRRFPMRRADFFVLQSPDVPSVLVELGFLSNVKDSENLTSEVWRKRVAEAVARGVVSFFDGTR